MVAEWRSTSTRENAIETARLIQDMPGKKVLLTSDFPMYRAIRVFRKQGIEATPMLVPDVLPAVAAALKAMPKKFSSGGLIFGGTVAAAAVGALGAAMMQHKTPGGGGYLPMMGARRAGRRKYRR